MTSEANTINLSENGVSYLVKREGYSDTSYSDGRNGRAIGHGINENSHPEEFRRYGEKVTPEQARQQVRNVNRQHGRDLRRRLGPENWDSMSQGQRDNILIPAYNIGPRRTAEAIEKNVKAKNWAGVRDDLKTVAPSGWVGSQKIDLSSRRKEDADNFYQSSPTNDGLASVTPTENSTSDSNRSSSNVSGAAISGAAIGTVAGVPASCCVGGTTISVVTGVTGAPTTLNIALVVSFSNPATALCCFAGLVVAGTVVAAGSAIYASRKKTTH